MIAARFPDGLAAAYAAPERLALEQTARAVVLSGGYLQDARLLAVFEVQLQGLPMMVHRRTPANDGGLGLGQALVALARGRSNGPVR